MLRVMPARQIRDISNLKITKIRTTPVSVPMKGSVKFSVGGTSGTSKVIVEVETNEGITGLGETFPLWVKDIIDHTLSPILIGENPFNMERLTSKCLPTNANLGLPYVDVYNLQAFGGIEMAIWDIMGKICGVPSAMLMGGIYREEVPFSEYVFVSKQPGESPANFNENVVKYCKKMVSEYKSPFLEFKVGTQRPSDDIEMVRLIREGVGEETKIRADANCGWSESTALLTLRKMEEYCLDGIEEPSSGLPADSRIRKVIKIPISVHWPRVRDVADWGLDAVVMNPLNQGGFGRTKKHIAIAEDLGVDFWLHSRSELGIGTAAYIHFLATTRHLVQPSQAWTVRVSEDFLTKEGEPRFERGVIRIPEGEGLGVTLDVSKLEKYHQLFLDVGEYNWLNSTGKSPPFY